MPIVTNGLIRYFNSKQGVNGNTWQNIAPSTLNTGNATISGATVRADGMYYDGTDDYAQVSTPTELLRETSFTIEVMVDGLTSNGNYADIFAPLNSYMLYKAGTDIWLYMFRDGIEGDDINSIHIGGYYTGQKVYFSIVFDITNRKTILYANGALLREQNFLVSSNFKVFAGNTFRIGSYAGDNPRGIIDCLRIYNRALILQEIQQNYAIGSEVGLDEEPPQGTKHTKSLTESITITDSIINKAGSKSIIDNVSTTESKTVKTSRSFADPLDTTDSITVIPPDIPNVYTKELIDAVAFNEAFTKSAYTEKILNDAILTDELISKNFTIAILDLINTNEQDRGNSVDRDINDTLNINDSLAQGGNNRANLTDQIIITDTINKAFAKVQSDNVATGESKNEHTAKELFEDLIPVDLIAFTEGKTILLTDSLMSSDSIDKAVKRLQNDLADLSDSIVKQSDVSVRLYDVIVSADEISVFNPNAQQYIGTINLKGKRELYVYLKAKHQLNIRLKARQELIIHLKGRIDMTMENQNFTVHSGDTKYIRFPIEGVPDLTGLSISWSASKHKNAGNPTLIKRTNDGISIVNNEVQIKLDPDDTANLSGPYYHECKITDSFGNHSKVLTGHLSIK